MTDEIAGTSAADIADSVRTLQQRGVLRPGDLLPPVRALADQLGVNRNTVVAAYRQLTQAGVVVTRGRGGTLIAGLDPVAQEGFAADSVLRDVGTGNPDPRLIPDLTPALASVAGRPVLYGEPVIDPDLERFALSWMQEALDPALQPHLTVTSGASDAIERLLAQSLTRDDAVALEDPCFLSTMNIVRLGGYRPVPVAVDDEGMTVAGLQAALDAGVRAVVCTPRAQNPTGASLTARRAEELRDVLDAHPYVLVIEDDHFSLLAPTPYASIIGPAHERWALVRSVSKFLGPDMRLAVTASDPVTAERLALRLSPGTMWVSHVMQQLAAAMLRDEEVHRLIATAGARYAARNRSFVALLAARGVQASGESGLNVWVDVRDEAAVVADRLARRGWLVRPGSEFTLEDESAGGRQVRVTVHDLDDAELRRLADDVAAAAGPASTEEGA